MSASKRFRKSTLRLFNRYGSSGTLSVPLDNGVYNRLTGDTDVTYNTFPIRYTGLPTETNSDSDYGLAAFLQSKVTLYVLDNTVVVNETCFITDLNGVKWGLSTLNTVFCGDDSIIAYTADAKAHK